MIPVVMITDPNYVFAARITIRSMLKSRKPDTRYEIHVLGVGLSDADVAALRLEDPTVDVRNEGNRYRDFCKCHTHVSTAALYKFDMADLFPQYDKVLYIDVDVLVLDDLTELFNMDISSVYASAVLDYRGMALLDYHKKMGLQYYFFSGMMVCNLARWRSENLRDKFLEIKKNGKLNGCMDQDVFNLVFHDEIRVLELKYDCPTMRYWGKPGLLESFYRGEELAGAQRFTRGLIEPGRNVVVLHYFMKSKPWKSLRNDRYMRYWWRFLTPKEAVRIYSGLLWSKFTALFHRN
ncbi:MAG: glycosyltransferase [Victivallaceae bacterium]|nr:glycosyltransferase [Victivallaceae bacterium]